MKMGRRLLWTPVLALLLWQCDRTPPEPDDAVAGLSAEYIARWKQFHPSRAFASGDKASATLFEDYGKARVAAWIDYNRRVLDRLSALPAELGHQDAVDARMLTRQCRLELERWAADEAHKTASVYAGLVSQAMTHLLVRDRLSPAEKAAALRKRLTGVAELCQAAVDQGISDRPLALSRAIRTLNRTADFFADQLPDLAAAWTPAEDRQTLTADCARAAERIRALANLLEREAPDDPNQGNALGREAYARKLPIALDREITPEQLADQALSEIQAVRALMAQRARAYWRKTYPGQTPPDDFSLLVGKAMEDMEANRENDQAAFLALFKSLTDRAEAFTRERELATLPSERTLFVGLSPAHFAGAAVGGVYVAGPFDPEADTLFYIPSIADDAPAQAKDGFYRSFNNHFNSMIIAHEMFPGHYMQFKVAAENPRLTRALFANGVYVEGWGTFCELLALEAGWDSGSDLTWLAHLRKRLENAVRAYVSVAVHCEGWDREKMTDFAVNTGLLPPQFAENLWARAVTSPFQIPTYFLGFHDFIRLRQAERQRLGGRFVTRDFVDAVLRAGAVPIDALPAMLQAVSP